MIYLEIDDFVEILLLCLALACAVILFLEWSLFRLRKPAETEPPKEVPTWLFQDDMLIDATEVAQKILHRTPQGLSDWTRLSIAIFHRFPDFPATVPETPLRDPLCLKAAAPDTAELQIADVGGALEVSLIENAPIDAGDRHRLISQSLRCEVLAKSAYEAPFPAWRTDLEGKVIGTNRAYRALVSEIRQTDANDPGHLPLFPAELLAAAETAKTRIALTDAHHNRVHWFDVSAAIFDNWKVFYAINIDAVVNAEVSQRNFVQTLTKTFAQLSTGLAIFDRDRQLALFNPALIELTTLSVDFLSARPNLASFFDQLRDARVMPEPKSYASWRERITELVVAAADGRYQETWSLPSGQTYRITGRPHPDGAIAFLIEDVTAEMSLTRKFRSQLELGQSVIDIQDEAIAVFSGQGVLTLSNAAYRDLWGIDPESSFAETTILDASRHWQEKCRPNSVWSQLCDAVVDFSDRSEWSAEAVTREGKPLICRVIPLSSGATFIGFSPGLTVSAKQTIEADA